MNKCWCSRGIATNTPQLAETVKIGTTYEGGVIRVKHMGSCASPGEIHDKICGLPGSKGNQEKRGRPGILHQRCRADEPEFITYLYYPVVIQDCLRPCRNDPDQELADFTRKGGTTG